MWRFVSAGRTGDNGHLFSMNDHQGRQTWEFDPTAGTPEQRAQVEALRARFKRDRGHQKHSSDELLRLQAADKIAAKAHSPPTDPLPADGAPPSAERVMRHLRGAVSFYECLQQEDGHFPGDYGGPMFLMPGLVIALYTMGKLDEVLSKEHQKEMLRYLDNHQNDDGGFGLHIEGGSTMFGTALRFLLFVFCLCWLERRQLMTDF